MSRFECYTTLRASGLVVTGFNGPIRLRRLAKTDLLAESGSCLGSPGSIMQGRTNMRWPYLHSPPSIHVPGPYWSATRKSKHLAASSRRQENPLLVGILNSVWGKVPIERLAYLK